MVHKFSVRFGSYLRNIGEEFHFLELRLVGSWIARAGVVLEST